MQEKNEGITIDANVQGGKPVIKGTRVPVEVITGALASGMTTEEVCNEYRVQKMEILACLKYATEILSEEKVLEVSN